ncbi:class I SAM-dependent methyltransferase [Nocardia jejuensis]|uniref:class I SAM-dependent methyltransferase n=1 Tax=Nocardia jejuensis TaxID=328049 RepID=UPI00082FEB41|nr:methyltransferase [Nocardia jejuensis]
MSTVHWTENDETCSARWHSENGTGAPSRIVVVDDELTANAAHRLARAGTGMLWRGDYHNARQLLRALDRRVQRDTERKNTERKNTERKNTERKNTERKNTGAESFSDYRAARSARARMLGMLLVEVESDYSLALRRAPDIRQACVEAYGEPDGARVIALTELQGVLSAQQWHEKGVEVPALGARIHASYGVFSPVRGEYVDLAADAPLPGTTPRVAFDLGTGTGVLAAVLARRGVGQVVATDINPRAVECARANIARLGLGESVRVVRADLYPEGTADLIVCNPPWLPADPTSALEAGVYDPNSDMLHRFLDGLTAHLTPGGEGWLILSDLAEHLELRASGELLERISAAGLRVVDKYDTAPRHPRARDTTDGLHAARGREITSLWRLAPKDAS